MTWQATFALPYLGGIRGALCQPLLRGLELQLGVVEELEQQARLGAHR